MLSPSNKSNRHQDREETSSPVCPTGVCGERYWLLSSQLLDLFIPMRGIALWYAKEKPAFPPAVQEFYNYCLAAGITGPDVYLRHSGTHVPGYGYSARLACTAAPPPAPRNTHRHPSPPEGGATLLWGERSSLWGGGGGTESTERPGRSRGVPSGPINLDGYRRSRTIVPVEQRGELMALRKVRTC